MSRYAENQLIAHLLDEDSLEYLVKSGMPLDWIPTPELRDVYEFALDYYVEGKRLAPTEGVFNSHEVSAGRTIANLLDDLETDWREGADTNIEWVYKSLKGSHVSVEFQIGAREGAQQMAEADDESRPEVFDNYVSKMVQLSSQMQDRTTRVDVREAIGGRLEAYELRASGFSQPGLTMGLPEVDEYTNLIQPGELAMFAAFAKLGKSYLLDIVAVKEWEAGRVPALFTLENSMEMTLDRIACLSCGVNSTAWQRGTCEPDEVERVRDKVREMEGDNHPFLLFSPEPGHRSPESMVRQAQIFEADSMIIDQLSHIEYNGRASQRNTQVAETMNALSVIVASGHHPIPCLIAHQINREGKTRADKCGYHEMMDLAESSSAERYCGFVFSGYQSHDMYITKRVLLQTLAARREATKSWDMSFRPEIGFAAIRGETNPYE